MGNIFEIFWPSLFAYKFERWLKAAMLLLLTELMFFDTLGFKTTRQNIVIWLEFEILIISVHIFTKYPANNHFKWHSA